MPDWIRHPAFQPWTPDQVRGDKSAVWRLPYALLNHRAPKKNGSRESLLNRISTAFTP
jgi:hypothetical protein